LPPRPPPLAVLPPFPPLPPPPAPPPPPPNSLPLLPPLPPVAPLNPVPPAPPDTAPLLADPPWPPSFGGGAAMLARSGVRQVVASSAIASRPAIRRRTVPCLFMATPTHAASGCTRAQGGCRKTEEERFSSP